METSIYNDENIAKYFAGELDEKILESMEKNFMQDREKEKEIRDFSRLWEKSSELAGYDKIDADADWDFVRQRMGFDKKSKKIPFVKYFSRIAAILILAVGLAYLFNQLVKQVDQGKKFDYLQFAAKNVAREFVLPDSSKVFLNKDARLVYNDNYGKTNRDVILEGEAFFQVEKNKQVPFKVFVGNSTIEVLGTQFNIKPDEESVTVSVVSGHVAFYETTKKENRVDLLKDQQSKYDSEKGTFEPKSTVDGNILAWRTHELEFKNADAKYVLDVISRYFGKKLEYNDKVDLNWEFTGAYKNEATLTEILNDMDHTHPNTFKAQIKNDKLIISPKGAK